MIVIFYELKIWKFVANKAASIGLVWLFSLSFFLTSDHFLFMFYNE